MLIRRAAITACLALAALTGCSSSSETPAPRETVTATPPATEEPALSVEEMTAQCVDAVANIRADASGEVPSEPVPPECEGLSESAYLDAYMDGISQSNQDQADAFQDRLDEEAAEDAAGN